MDPFTLVSAPASVLDDNREVFAEGDPVYWSETSNEVVLYNPTSHALTITSTDRFAERPPAPPLVASVGVCPYCNRPLDQSDETGIPLPRFSRVPNYFQLLAIANEVTSRPSSPSPVDRPLGTEATAEGYYEAFFKEELKLGMGANGSVFLCQHVLNGNPLGRYVVKKIAVGESRDYLLQTLSEVRLLETLRHENIITYHHSWLESHKFSSFGPLVPTLFILMQWAEGGSLDDFISARQGNFSSPSGSGEPDHDSGDHRSRAERIRAFRMRQQNADGGIRTRNRNLKAVHLLSLEEVRGLFGDIVAGLAFLHDHSILHLDLKPGNVLLTWDEGQLVPRAMLSDFGTSRDMLKPFRKRSGMTGTLEYTPPESLMRDSTGEYQQIDSKADMWSLGMILHKLLFFRLPYANEDIDNLEKEIMGYRGFIPSAEVQAACTRRGLPRAILRLLESLLDTKPSRRPTCDRVLTALRAEKMEPLRPHPSHSPERTTLIARPSPPLQREGRPGDSSPTSELNAEAVEGALVPASLSPTPNLAFEPRTSDASSPMAIAGVPEDEDTEEDGQAATSSGNTPSSFARKLSRPQAVKTIKSVLLFTKILSLSTMCASSRPGTLTICVASALAIADIWTQSVPVSIALGLGHLAILTGVRYGHGCNTVVLPGVPI
ncbi:hypothetical protein BOTBODRAFT_181484 [Botryobasidium botryosum FD-172 SS1]|uniref:non-specific serine/threonine protein kinase n=1 Tax=Botryobasidium botryosum (strain FD-172 SS1) TaxID=930990 RepID=A0A067LW84_BOTB1|nr:hypothetical protein BOTBODRAFT_181484 [Botryobasidium botryosum FD-172 SS1]